MANYTWRKESNYQIKTRGEKETYKYLGILEADTIKQVEIKKTESQKNQKAPRDKTL